MTINERLELIRAGYTKADIEAFEKGAEPEQPKPEQPKPITDTDITQYQAIMKSINDLTKAIQLQNMQKIGLDTPGGMTAEEALAAGVFGNKIGGGT